MSICYTLQKAMDWPDEIYYGLDDVKNLLFFFLNTNLSSEECAHYLTSIIEFKVRIDTFRPEFSIDVTYEARRTLEKNLNAIEDFKTATNTKNVSLLLNSKQIKKAMDNIENLFLSRIYSKGLETQPGRYISFSLG